MASYSDKDHERAFRLWFTLRSYRAVSRHDGMPKHPTVMAWAGDYHCRHHCPWHNWKNLKAAYAQRSAAVGDRVRGAATGKIYHPTHHSLGIQTPVLPGGCCQERHGETHHQHEASGRRTTANGIAGESAELGCGLNSSRVGDAMEPTTLPENLPPNRPPTAPSTPGVEVPLGEERAAQEVELVDADGNTIEDLCGLVRSRAERLTIIRALEGLGIERLRTLQVQQEEEARTHVPLVDMKEARAAMDLIFKAWDEERLELGNPTRIIGGEAEVRETGIDIAEVLRELDVETRHAFMAACRRQLAQRTRAAG